MAAVAPAECILAITACPTRNFVSQNVQTASYHRALTSCYPGRFFRYDNLTVTIQHDTGGEGYFRTLAARGSPYMTFEFALVTPLIKSNGNILEVMRKRGDIYLYTSYLVDFRVPPPVENKNRFRRCLLCWFLYCGPPHFHQYRYRVPGGVSTLPMKLLF